MGRSARRHGSGCKCNEGQSTRRGGGRGGGRRWRVGGIGIDSSSSSRGVLLMAFSVRYGLLFFCFTLGETQFKKVAVAKLKVSPVRVLYIDSIYIG